jgi:hypothetical protein
MVFSEQIMDRDIDCGLGVAVTVEARVHGAAHGQRTVERATDQAGRHLGQRRAGAERVVRLIRRADGASFTPTVGAVVGDQPHEGRIQRRDFGARHGVWPADNRQVQPVDVEFGDTDHGRVPQYSSLRASTAGISRSRRAM